MKKRHISTLLVTMAILFLFVVCSLAYAAATDNSTQDSSTALIIAIGLFFNGAANIGSIVFFAKRYVSKVDKTDETLPVLVATLESTKKAMDQHARSIEELYNTKNSHEIKLTKIETIHKMRGCDKGIEAQAG